MLSGPAGVGKTRLAREVVARLGRGATVHWALATESARDLPLGAFGGALDSLGPPTTDTLTRAARLLAPDARSVVAVDDAHHLDDLSAVLVHRLATRDMATVVITARDGEQPPDAIDALWKNEHLTRLRVAPLSEESTYRLVEEALGGAVDPDVAARLWSLTRGNALFLRHLVDGECAAGRLRQVDGSWRWIDEPRVDAELAALVRRQIGDLPSEIRDTVDVLALAEPLGLPAVRSLAGDTALEDAEARGLVTVDTEGGQLRARLAHPMYGEVRRAELGEARARRLRGLVAETLVAVGEALDDPVRRAVLVLDSDLPSDADLFHEAAQHALVHFDLELGERLARAAVEAGGGVDARLTLVFALIWMARGAEAEALLSPMRSEAATPEEVTRVTVPSVGNLFWIQSETARGQAVLEEGLTRLPDGPLRDQLLGMRVAVDAASGRADSALPLGTELMLRRTLTGPSAVITAASLVLCAGVRGDMAAADQAAEYGLEVGSGDHTTIGPVFMLGDSWVMALRLAGRLADARQVAERITRFAEEVAGRGRLMSLLGSAHAALAAGRLRTADRLIRASRDGLPSPYPFEARWLMILTQALALRGRVEDACHAQQELERVRNVLYRLSLPEVPIGQAWIAGAEGATTEAVGFARTAAEMARSACAPAYEVLAWQVAAQLGDPGGAARLEELCEVVEGPRAPVAHAHASALARHDGDALLAMSTRWEEIGDGIAAADAAAQAAILLREAGRKGSALAAAARAQQLVDERCEGARTPAILAAARPLPLTAREREIATLAASGLSNREIAERLSVSVRTVEGHLYRASQKLGVHERSELAALFTVGWAAARVQ